MTDAPLVALAIQALQDHGRLVRHEEDRPTFSVMAAPGDLGPVLGVTFEHSGSVVCYFPWEIDVPAEVVPAMLEFVARANTGLTTSALEFDLGARSLSLRAGVEFGERVAEFSPESRQVLLGNVLDEVLLSARMHNAAVRALCSGTPAVEAIELVTQSWEVLS